MKTLLLLLSVSFALIEVVQSQGFEAPDYPAGEEVPAVWTVTGTGRAAITDETAAFGTQSLVVTNAQASRLLAAAPTGGVWFIQFSIRPEFLEGPASEALNIGGARLAFQKTSEGDSLVALVDTEGTPRLLASYEATAPTWMEITLRLDAGRGRWDLFIDGTPLAENLPFAPRTTTFSITGTNPLFLDEIRELTENPLFPDQDRDGMSDAEERAYGLDPTVDDRDLDLDSDGLSNIAELFAGASPKAYAGFNPERLVFVDNLAGNDANSGLRPYAAARFDGPKRSLKSAMAAAPSGDVIVILPGTGLYDEGSRGAPGKNLTIKTIGPVTIK